MIDELKSFQRDLVEKTGIVPLKDITIELPIQLFHHIYEEILRGLSIPEFIPTLAYIWPIRTGQIYALNTDYGSIQFRPVEDVDYELERELDRMEKEIIHYE